MNKIISKPSTLMMMSSLTHVIGLIGFTGVYLYVVFFTEGLLFYKFPWNIIIPIGLLLWWLEAIYQVISFTKKRILADSDGIVVRGKRYLWVDVTSALGSTQHAGFGSTTIRITFKDNEIIDVPVGMTNVVELWKLIQNQVPCAQVYEGQLK